MNNYDRYLIGAGLGVLALGIGTCLFAARYSSFINHNPKVPPIHDVQQGYVIPSKLEIDVQDLDGNGDKETILRYGGKPFLLKVDKGGKPFIQSYEVEPAKIVPK
jgi:hypothetical protein